MNLPEFFCCRFLIFFTLFFAQIFARILPEFFPHFARIFGFQNVWGGGGKNKMLPPPPPRLLRLCVERLKSNLFLKNVEGLRLKNNPFSQKRRRLD